MPIFMQSPGQCATPPDAVVIDTFGTVLDNKHHFHVVRAWHWLARRFPVSTHPWFVVRSYFLHRAMWVVRDAIRTVYGAARLRFIPWVLERCNTCSRPATWIYQGGGYACDRHVQRGCSCRAIGNLEGEIASEAVDGLTYVWMEHEGGVSPLQRLDERGRLQPCIEHWNQPFGFPRSVGPSEANTE